MTPIKPSDIVVIAIIAFLLGAVFGVHAERWINGEQDAPPPDPVIEYVPVYVPVPNAVHVEIDANVPIETFEVTAYTAGPESTGKSPGHPQYGITASGERVEDGVTVACPPSLPFGTRLLIEDVGERVCFDRGSAISDGYLDVYIPDLDDALAFGRRELDVIILSENNGEDDDK